MSCREIYEVRSIRMFGESLRAEIREKLKADDMRTRTRAEKRIEQ